MLNKSRKCPLCSGNAGRSVFPYSTVYNKKQFNYLKCKNCSSVFVNPVPDDETFALMYAKADYHDCHYMKNIDVSYTASAKTLKKFINSKSTVLDYGCGVGNFLKSLSEVGFIPLGVEFDTDAAIYASKNSNCSVVTVDQFFNQKDKELVDAIHMGDVLEHLPDPLKTLNDVLKFLKPGGVLFVEGPIETNPSLVYWSALLFGSVKRFLNKDSHGLHTPTHLFRTNAEQQLAFFSRTRDDLELLYWDVYETGWPYINGNLFKRFIAKLAIFIAKIFFFKPIIGNRFVAVFKTNKLS